MRVEQFGVGVIAHVLKRGAHKMPIVKNDADRWRFLMLLRYLNDANVPRNWERDVTPELLKKNFSRPKNWPEQGKYVEILSYCLMDNHFHLLVEELVDGGISKFMQRVCRSMAANFNARYNGSGALFQGPFKARIVYDDTYLQRLAVYINIKNTFEKYPKGMNSALNNFSAAYDWAASYPFSSTADFVGKRCSSILNHKIIEGLFPSPSAFKGFAREVMKEYDNFPNDFNDKELD